LALTQPVVVSVVEQAGYHAELHGVVEMAKFTDAEAQLVQRVGDDRLQTSLANIRQAVEDIWALDAPRIIKDFTDHGTQHYVRISGFVSKLLAANDGKALSSQEMYLLLAGVYLHDVGMQCDVLKFPDIKAKAQQLGARFDVGFSTLISSGYNLDEQKEIRKNHQYLSAAWIDCAIRTGETVLGAAAKSIPSELIDDLMDVCKHHTKLPITDCPPQFKFDPTGRKQLVAALLRFADELDIDSRRVSIETVKTFSLDPRNSIYWWIHNLTKVIFSSRNVVVITIRLSPSDVDKRGPLIHSTFITEFQSKNRPVLTVLAQHGVPIVISADSKVVADERAEVLPPEIVQALHAIQKRTDPVRELAEEVRVWLRAVRYETSDIKRQGDRAADMVATVDLGTVKQRVLVRCVGGEITVDDIEQVDQLVDLKTPQGWLISDKRVSKAARSRAASDDTLQVFTLSDFLRQKVWGPYFDFLTSLVNKDRIPELYVDVGCYKQEINEKGEEVVKDKHNSLEAYIDQWLKERGKMHVSLLGSFGAGKTWFCRHYAYAQLQRYLKDPANERLPLLITLRAFAKAMTAQQLINDALLEQYKLQFLGSAFEVFDEMNRRGKLLLILDGFDEMARQVDYQTVVDNFWELARLVDEHSKVILTSRTEYFRWAEESEKILAGKEFGRKILVLEPPKFEVVYLELFDEKKIKKVIVRRHGPSGAAVAERILKNKNLAEMARRPVLIELLLAALQEVSDDVLENPGRVYLYATNKLLLRNIDTRRTFTTTADKLYFLCELAWEMIKTENLRIHYGSIPDRIKTYFGDRIKDQHELDTWDFDLRNQTLLHRDAAGYYEFAHKSLAEYFSAFKFAAELGCLDQQFAETYREASGKPCNLAIQPKDATKLAQTFGALDLGSSRMSAVAGFLHEMSSRMETSKLWDIIEQTKGRPWDESLYVGGNAATLLTRHGESFVGRNLSGAVLRGARLPRDLRLVDLEGADLTDVFLSYADLRDSNVTDARFSPSGLLGADMRGVKGLAERFFAFVSLSPERKRTAFPPLRRPFTLFRKERAPTTAEFQDILSSTSSAVAVITGPPGAGKTSLLLSTGDWAEQVFGPKVLWFTPAFYFGAYWPKILHPVFSHSTFYRLLATFMTVGGYPTVFDYFDSQGVFSDTSRRAAIPTPSVRQEAFSLMLPIFEKEKWLICLDDVGGPDLDVSDFVQFFASRKMSTKIIATMQKVPATYKGHVITLMPKDASADE
jgi:hypothetical protein